MHPIWIVWKDERYTIPENLLADAKKKLKEQAYPVLSFEVTVNDLAETDDRYSFLKMGLYDIAHVIIDEHTEIIEKVIKLQRHHDSPEKNKITLSSEPQTITGKVNDAISILGNDGEKLKGSVLQQAQEMATKLINAWAEKGYIYQTQNEIYILDALPKENAKYCIRMNLGGIAFSQNGWQGPYNSAWTIDGKFNADFITAGTLRGIRIMIGDNFSVMEDGTMKCADATMRNVTVESGTFKGNLTTNYDAYIGHNLHLSHEVGMFSQITLGENGDTAITMSDDQIRIGILNNNQDLLSRPFISITKDDIFLNLNEDNHIRISSILGVTMKTKGKVIDMNYDI